LRTTRDASSSGCAISSPSKQAAPDRHFAERFRCPVHLVGSPSPLRGSVQPKSGVKNRKLSQILIGNALRLLIEEVDALGRSNTSIESVVKN